ncbi:MAG: DNA polymerase Y family protein [Candidatus Binatia bacterium]|nr:DNA polymerase Y family protein [Candidatus Binatia bacterium]
MPRFACVVVPRFSTAALLRAEPELRGCPLVICRPDENAANGRVPGPRSVLVGVSREAERLGVRPGMTVAQALVRQSDLVVRPLDECAIGAAREALIDVAGSVSPRVEPEGNAVYLDIEGLEKLFSSDGGIAAALSTRAERLGLTVGIGTAGSKTTARIAAGLAARDGDANLVPVGKDAAWLMPHPLSVLTPVAEPKTFGAGARATWPALQESFRRLGLRRLGDLARLPRGEVGSRFGKAGTRLWRIAAGKESMPLLPEPPALEFTEGMSLEYSVESLEALLFLMRGLIDRLIHRLAIHGLSCSGLRVGLDLADGGHAERRVGVLAPTADVKALAILTRHAIEAEPPREAIVGVRAVAIADRARPTQLDLFRPTGPSPERLATTLVRLAALCGSEKVGRPVPPRGHCPEAFTVTSFDPVAEERGRPPEDLEPELPRSGRSALRALRPPRRAQVFQEGGSIAYVRAPGLGGRAVVSGGPWRIETEWWSERPCRRDYYDVQLSDGGIYRLYRDLGNRASAGDQWFIDGCYD